ncbi:MAG: ABC transporter, partial [Alphaproteobacteria bacterium]|nr:ABC transporter [Alphaproteobacteria bacterium]
MAEKIKTELKMKFHEHYEMMWPFVKPYLFRAVLAILVSIPIGALDSVIALSLKPYMDIVVVEKSARSPIYIPFLIIAFTSLQGFLNYIATYLNTWVGTKINQDLKRHLFKKLMRMETAYFDETGSGVVLQRFSTDCDTACSGLLDNLRVFVARFFSSFSLVCVLIYNSWQLAIIAVLVMFAAFLPLSTVKKRIKETVM